MKLERATIRCGEVALAALVYRAAGPARGPCVVLSHGYTASKESVDLLAAYLCGRGWACASFDFRGHKLGASTGRLTGVGDAVEDLRAVSAWAMKRFARPHCVLVGHSMGGLVSFAVAAQSPEVAGVAAIAVGPDPLSGFRSPVGGAMMTQRGDYVSGADAKTFLAELDTLVPMAAEMAGRPTLCVAARGDVLIKPERVRELAGLAGPLAEFAEVDGGHQEAPNRARGVVAAWLEREFLGK